MGTFLRTILILACFLDAWIISVCHGCISTCQCTPRRQKGRTVDCGGLAEPISSLADLKFPPDTVHLDLSYNALEILKQGWFIQLSRLQRLNLSSNKITVIEPGAFDGLQSLKRLDLSHNQIDSVKSHMFSGLPKLEKLSLSFNRITSIPDGTLNDLTALKKFEFRSTYLWCDCHLNWMLKWAKKNRVRIPSSTVCSLPLRMKGRPLSKLKKKDLVCEPLDLPIFDILPSGKQLVFEGDKLPFECHASVTAGQMEINWFKNGKLVKTDKSKGLNVHTVYNENKTMVIHKVMVKSLIDTDKGEWSCVISTPTENFTKSVLIGVHTMIDTTMKCPEVTNRTAKGVYIWHESTGGQPATQRCEDGSQGSMATHQCGLDGSWYNLDISRCNYLREVTKHLAQLAEADSKTLDISTQRFEIEVALTTTKEGETLDSLDVFFLAKIMESTLLPHALDNDEIAGFVVDTASDEVMTLPAKVLRKAQVETKSATKVTMVLSKMLQGMHSASWEYISKEIVVMRRNQDQVSRQGLGLSCNLREAPVQEYKESQDADEIKEDESKESSGLLDSGFECDHEGQYEAETGLVSISIPPANPERTSVIKKPKPPVEVSTVVRTSSSSTEQNSPPTLDISTSSSTLPQPVENSENVTNPTALNNADEENTTTSIRNHQSLPTQHLPDANKDKSLSQPNHSRRFTRDTSFGQGYRDSARLAEGFPSIPLSADQLRELNISTKLSRFPTTFNISSPSISKLPTSFGKNPFPVFTIRGPNSKVPLFGTNIFRPHYQPQRKDFYVVVIYRTGKLFPILKSDTGDPTFERGTWAVVTPVVVVSLGDKKKPNSTTPIVLNFKVEDPRRPVKAAHFNYQAINGYGGWSIDGCEIVHKNETTVTVHVHHFSAFAVLQDISYVYRLANFPMEPVIYIGSGLCALCMFIILNTYICCFGSIGVPKKIKHAVINLCLSSFLMLVVFALGINRTSMELPCQMVGISLHYFTLCALFWITITANITYKKFVKADRPPEPPPEMVPMPLPPKPILQFYFVGYGVPIIICGITAAVNLDFYAGIKYCFLEWEPSLGAFYAPVALLVAWNLVLFMRISCVVRNSTESENEGTNESDDNEIHNNEIELVPSQPDTNISNSNTTTHNINSRHSNQISNSFSHHRYSRAAHDSISEDDAASLISLPDQERRPITQLRALVAIHFLFIVMWTCGALAIAKPFHLIIPYQELIFSYLYGLTSTLFGIFMLVYFLLTRNDSRLSWKRKFGCAPPETYTTPLEVTETQLESPSPLPTPQITVPVANGSVVKSNSNTNLSVYSQKSSNITKAYNMKNNASKQSNINLILANSSDLSYGSAQENFPNFYNPRQNGAAKKFWQKNRQHSKVMNKDINRDLNSSLTDNNSGTDVNHPRLSHGTSSDANTHLSIEIQIQPKNQSGSKQGSFCGSREIPVHISNSHNNMAASYGAISIEHNNNINNMDSGQQDAGLEHNDLSSTSKDKNVNTTTGSNASLPHYQNPRNSGSSLNTGNHHASAFTPVQPRANSGNSNNAQVQNVEEGNDNSGDILDQVDNSKKESSPPRNQLSGPDPQLTAPKEQQDMNGDVTQRPPNPGVAWSPFPCSLPPLPSHPNSFSFTPPPQYHQVMQQHYGFDFGQYPVVFNISQTQPPMPPQAPASAPMPPAVRPAAPYPATNFNIPPSPYLVQNQPHNRTPKSMSPVSSSSQSQSHAHYNNRHHKRNLSNSWRPLSGGDSSDSSRSRPRQIRSNGSPGRINITVPRSPVASEPAHQVSDTNSNHLASSQKKARSVDGDHHSDPTHRKKHHKQDKHHHNKLTNKQRSLGWDEHLKNRTPKINYVYVNHMYRDKVMHKLIKQASESDDLANKAFWLPRSASEYEKLTQKGFCSMADDSSSSSDEDSMDNIWIPQRSSSDFQKKETSV